MTAMIGINDHSKCRPGEQCYAGRPASEVPARDDRCTCSAAEMLEMAEMKGYFRGMSAIADFNVRRLHELSRAVREAHAKEAR
jgi:hypothetical protein